MANAQLSAGSVPAMRSKTILPNLKPIVQVLSATHLQHPGSERFKLEISDGTSYTTAMLSTQHNELVKSKQVRPNTIIRVTEYITNEVRDTRIIILLDVEVVEQAAGRIGSPVECSNNNPAPVNQPVVQPNNRVQAPANFPPAQPQVMNQAPIRQQPPVVPMQQQQFQQPMEQASFNQSFGGSSSNRAPVSMVNPVSTMTGGGLRAAPRTIPIKLLNPYNNKWTIKARVTSKSGVKSWDKGPNNQGKLFSVDLVDSEGTEIRATFFREAVDLFLPRLEVGNVYTFSEGKVKVANRQFSAIQNEYELNFGKEAQVQAVQDSGDIVRVQLQPVPIATIGSIEPKTNIDVCGIAIEIGEVSAFTSKAGKDLRKLEFELLDKSNTSVKVSVWGEKADEVAAQLRMAGPNPVIAIKSCVVGDYGGRTLSTVNSTTVLINPVDLAQSGVLRSWFDAGGGRTGVSSLSVGRGGESGSGETGRGPAQIQDRMTFDGIKTNGLGRNGQQDFCDVKGFLMFAKKDNLWYPACCTEKCNKKVTKSPTDDRWFCEKCNQSFEQPIYRYIASFQVVDPTGSAWCTAFNDSANPLFGGHSASDLERIKREDEAQFEKIVEKSQFQEGVFRLKLKEELYQDQSRVKPVIMSFRPIDYQQEAKELLKGIELLQARQ